MRAFVSMRPDGNGAQGSVMRGGKQPGRPAGRPQLPREICAVIFHVRDLAPVEELVAALHARMRRKRPVAGRKRERRPPSGKTTRSRDGEHPPLYLADDHHLIALAPSRALARTWQRALERALGDAVEHVENRFIKRPRPSARAKPGAHARR